MVDEHFNIPYKLIDGGIICNNPTFYAAIMAEHAILDPNSTIPLRILSLGTGDHEEKQQ